MIFRIIKPLENVYVRIGYFNITYGNVAGLILLVLNVIRLILTYFCTYDLSKEFDLKVHESQPKEFTTTDTASSETFVAFSVEGIIIFRYHPTTHPADYTGFINIFIGRALRLVT